MSSKLVRSACFVLLLALISPGCSEHIDQTSRIGPFAVKPSTGPTDHSVEVIATGLDNPRGLAFAPNGDLYIAEAGRGGEGPCVEGPEGGEVCYGASGAVTRVRRGVQERIATGFPSLASPVDGGMASGPHGISIHGSGNIHVVIGLGADPAARNFLGPAGQGFGQLVKMRPNGRWRNIVDVSDHETAENPDGGELDSNPFGLTSGPGQRVVADAGANALLRVAANGRISTLAVFPDRMVQSPFDPPGTLIPMQSVPTSVVRAKRGYYVGELTGFPFPVGGARVYHVAPGTPPQVFADDFTNIIGIAMGRHGELFVLEIATNSLLSGDTTGALWRINADDSRDLLYREGLFLPGGLAVGADGAIYVTDCSVCAGGGRVLRILP